MPDKLLVEKGVPICLVSHATVAFSGWYPLGFFNECVRHSERGEWPAHGPEVEVAEEAAVTDREFSVVELEALARNASLFQTRLK